MKSLLDNLTRKLKTGENMAKENKLKKEKKGNRIVWFIFAIVIPVIIALFIAVLGLSIAGIDVVGSMKEKASTVPVVSSFVKTDEDKALEKQLEKANETIETQKEEITELTKEVKSQEEIIHDLELDITRLENRNKSEENLAGDSNTEGSDMEEVKKVASSFRKMEPEKAAKIIQNLEKNIAVDVLANLSGEVRGNILAEMEPKIAADLMK